MPTEILPCAHCGGIAKIVSPFTLHAIIRCGDCGIQTDPHDTIDEAIATWNSRVETDGWSTSGPGEYDYYHSDPGEYGRNPVTAEDVLRAAAQMRAEVEEMERKLGLDTKEGS